MNKNILIVVPSSNFGGGESYIYNLAKYLKSEGVNVVLFSACERLNIELNTLLKDIFYISDCVSLGVNTIKTIFSINRFVSTHKVDAVLLNGLPEMGVYSKFIKSDNVFSIGHSNEFWISENTKLFSKRFIKSLFIQGYGKSLKGLIGINSLAIDNMAANVDLKYKTRLIYNGVAPVYISKKVYNPKKIVFGRISRMVEGKGNDLLLKAFSLIIKEISNVKLVFAGDGPQLEHLRKLANSLGIREYVEFAGFISAEKFFSKIDCMISPSLMEATPMVILESFSCKVPVLATKVGGVPDLIEHLDTGYLFGENSIEELVNAMRYFVNNAEGFSDITERAHANYESHFTLDVMGKNTYDFIFDKA
ncbi:glycosyltransferase family 4 protein [Vibrio vulnificus]|nr:glycosyltransferase family 4 protein [Vibrio vulnificus]MCU8461330.1 glycosyltransferase family 4 protein [Vibrio vulnificus]